MFSKQESGIERLIHATINSIKLMSCQGVVANDIKRLSITRLTNLLVRPNEMDYQTIVIGSLLLIKATEENTTKTTQLFMDVNTARKNHPNDINTLILQLGVEALLTKKIIIDSNILFPGDKENNIQLNKIILTICNQNDILFDKDICIRQNISFDTKPSTTSKTECKVM